MKRTTKYVALDVHQATTVASVREDSGRVIARSVLPTDGGAQLVGMPAAVKHHEPPCPPDIRLLCARAVMPRPHRRP
jgi:hypothetical protein